MNCSMPGLPVHHQLLEFNQTQVHQVGDAIQPPHHLSSPSPPAPNPSQHQGLFQWANSSHEVAQVLELYIYLHLFFFWIIWLKVATIIPYMPKCIRVYFLRPRTFHYISIFLWSNWGNLVLIQYPNLKWNLYSDFVIFFSSNVPYNNFPPIQVSIKNQVWNLVDMTLWFLLIWNISSAFLYLLWHWHFCGEEASWFLEWVSIHLIFLNFERALKELCKLTVSPASHSLLKY